MARIIDKIQDHRRRWKRKQNDRRNAPTDSLTPSWFYSMEFFPPKTEAGLDNLLLRIDRMVARLDPLFIDVTWGHKGSTAAKTLAIASHAQRFSGVTVLLHLTCTGLTREQLAATLQQAKSCGIQNILALRGDLPKVSSNKRFWGPGDVSGGECDRAIDLVKLIRKLHGGYFGIAVAGHPERHPSSNTLEEEIIHLREKIEAGADFIITQLFYDSAVFFQYVKTCRSFGIHCPILPGIMPIQSYSSFVHITDYCGVSVPQDLLHKIEVVKDNDEAVKNIGCEAAVELCRQILNTPEDEGGVDGLHFYTLNLERSISKILMLLGALKAPSEASLGSLSLTSNTSSNNNNRDRTSSPSEAILVQSAYHRRFPWRASALETRSREDVRPIHWANRPRSYLMRTDDWDEFPNGRWSLSSSPAFGELSDSHFYSFPFGTDEERRNYFGRHPRKEKDVYDVFAQYIEGKIPYIPWCESPLQPESFTIQSLLAEINRFGFLSINSQPSVNGLASDHSLFGWGGVGGFVYQKAYCECFVHPNKMDMLLEMVDLHPYMMLYAVNVHGEEIRSGTDEGGVTALTWGVFPNREIIQPTIFDPHTFLIWSEEAFALWTTLWLNLYEMGSESYELIESIRDSYYLVAIIDNDYIGNTSETLWKCLSDLGHEREIRL